MLHRGVAMFYSFRKQSLLFLMPFIAIGFIAVLTESLQASQGREPRIADVYKTMPINIKQSENSTEIAQYFYNEGISKEALDKAIKDDSAQVVNVTEGWTVPSSLYGGHPPRRELDFLEAIEFMKRASEAMLAIKPELGKNSSGLGVQNKSMPKPNPKNEQPIKQSDIKLTQPPQTPEPIDRDLSQIYNAMTQEERLAPPEQIARHLLRQGIKKKELERVLEHDNEAIPRTPGWVHKSLLTDTDRTAPNMISGIEWMEKVLPELQKLEDAALKASDSQVQSPKNESAPGQQESPDIKSASTLTARLGRVPTPVLVGGGLLLLALTLYAVKRAYECVYAKKSPEQTENVSEKNQPEIAEEE